jgi:hypothetical protein
MNRACRSLTGGIFFLFFGAVCVRAEEASYGFGPLAVGENINIVGNYCDPNAPLSDLDGVAIAFLNIECYGEIAGRYQFYALSENKKMVLLKRYIATSRDWLVVDIEEFLTSEPAYIAAKASFKNDHAMYFAFSERDISDFNIGRTDSLTISFSKGLANLIIFQDAGKIRLSVDYRSAEFALAP